MFLDLFAVALFGQPGAQENLQHFWHATKYLDAFLQKDMWAKFRSDKGPPRTHQSKNF
jgi:hypothetical protein